MDKFKRFLIGIGLCLCALAVVLLASPFLSGSEPVSAAPIPLDSRVEALETTQATLLKRVAVLETVVASQTKPVAGVATSVPTSTETATDKSVEIVSVKDKITKSDRFYEQHAWIVVMKNNTDKRLSFDLTVEFQDKDGFIVDQDLKFELYIDPHETKQFTGVQLVNASISSNITRVVAESQITSTQ